jgi:hypothetical protein
MPVFSRLVAITQLIAVLVAPALAASVSQEYDYVIIGGGITGLVVANRLSEDKTSKFCLACQTSSCTDWSRRIHSRNREW